ncbi:uncharacterized protein V1518DRAFT_413233 [Limtongia smithiae]|uniref:uncharacterized protein n=1 Tax=Limtongia smithiae TaxID=1125753 RepID=UPI0034CDF31D
MTVPSPAASCATPSALSAATERYYTPREHEASTLTTTSATASLSFRTITSRSSGTIAAVPPSAAEEEYSADFSPEAHTKRVVPVPFPASVRPPSLSSSASSPAASFSTSPPLPTSFSIPLSEDGAYAAVLSETPLLPATPCVPVRPFDANKGYPLPTNCLTDLDWIAEYNAGAAQPKVLVPRDYAVFPGTAEAAAAAAAAAAKAGPAAAPVRLGAAPVPQATKTLSVKHSLVQADIDGDDSLFWYKSTTRFASPEDDWDYERLRRRIREFTSGKPTPSAPLVSHVAQSSPVSDVSSSASSTSGRARPQIIGVYSSKEQGLGPAAAVNETVRQTTVRRLKVVLAHLTGASSADAVTAESTAASTSTAATVTGASANDFGGIRSGIEEFVDGESVDIAKLRMAIEELSAGGHVA